MPDDAGRYYLEKSFLVYRRKKDEYVDGICIIIGIFCSVNVNFSEDWN